MAASALVLAACARSEDATAPVPTESNLAASKSDDITGELAQPDRLPGLEALAGAVRASLADSGGTSANARWLVGHADLDGDGIGEALAYLIDPMLCGTGGCSLYVLRDKGSGGGWDVVSKIGPAQLPIYLLPSKTEGWSDLGVTIAGGGARRAVMKVPHAADGYASNPTVAPATAISSESGTVLIADDYDKAVPVPAAVGTSG